MSNSKWIPSWFYTGCSEHNIKRCQKCTDDAHQKRVKLQKTLFLEDLQDENKELERENGLLTGALAWEKENSSKVIAELEAQLDAVRELLDMDAIDGAIVFASGDKAIYMEDLRQALNGEET